MVWTFNLGGAITVERLVNLVTLWPQLRPLIVLLTAIRLARNWTLWEYQKEIQKALHGEWWFILSREDLRRKWGVGMLVYSQIALGTNTPPMNELLKGRLMRCELRPRPDYLGLLYVVH